MQSSGYSQTPLSKKLGIKKGFKIRLVNQPIYYFELFNDMPADVRVIHDKKIKKDFIHYFCEQAENLQDDIVSLRNEIVSNGMIWVSWPKKSSKVLTDVSEDFIRTLALANGLVDIKVCALDDTWSALKLVIPVKER